MPAKSPQTTVIEKEDRSGAPDETTAVTADMKAIDSRSGVGAAIRLWVLPFTRFHRIPVFKRVWLYLFLMGGYTFVVDWIADRNMPTQVLKEASAAAYAGMIMGLLLVFRTNSAYERWWEGRKLWGQLVNDSRNLSLKIRTYMQVSNAEKMRLGELIISFSYALKHHLRGTRPAQPLPGIGLAHKIPTENLPVYVSGKMFDTVQQWYQMGRIDGFQLMQADSHLRAFMDICGACERIKNSPLAVSYRAFMRQGIALNLLVIPWFMASQFDIWWSMPVVLIGAYFLIGLELIAEDIEDPFGSDGDDLPLDNICNNIRRTVTEILPVEENQAFTTSIVLPRVDPLKEQG